MMTNTRSKSLAAFLCVLLLVGANPIVAWVPQSNSGGGGNYYATNVASPSYNYDVYPQQVGGAWGGNEYADTNGGYNNDNYNNNIVMMATQQAQPSQTRYFADRIQEARQRALANSLETNRHKAAVNVLGNHQQAQHQQVHHQVQPRFVNHNHQDYSWAPRRTQQVIDTSASRITRDHYAYQAPTADRVAITDDYVIYDVPSTPRRRLRPYRPNTERSAPMQRYRNNDNGYGYPQQQAQPRGQMVPSYNRRPNNNGNDQALLHRLASLTEHQKRSVLRQLSGLSSLQSTALTHAEPFNPALVKIDMSPQAVAYRQDIGRQRIAQARHDAMQRTQANQATYNYNNNNNGNWQQPQQYQQQNGNHSGNMPLPGWNNNNNNNNFGNNNFNNNNNSNNWNNNNGQNFGGNNVMPASGNSFPPDDEAYGNNNNNNGWGVWA